MCASRFRECNLSLFVAGGKNKLREVSTTRCQDIIGTHPSERSISCMTLLSARDAAAARHMAKPRELYSGSNWNHAHTQTHIPRSITTSARAGAMNVRTPDASAVPATTGSRVAYVTAVSFLPCNASANSAVKAGSVLEMAWLKDTVMCCSDTLPATTEAQKTELRRRTPPRCLALRSGSRGTSEKGVDSAS